MISHSAKAASVLTRSFVLYARAESWLGDRLLAEEIPIADGNENVDRSLRVPERVMLTVPRIVRGTDWTPTEDDSPLAANGQRLKVELGIGLGAGNEIEWLQRGWFVILNSDETGDSIEVECRGLLHLIDEARLVSPFQPTGTMTATAQGLVEPALTVRIDGPADRSVPSGINFDEDRLGALIELFDAWPAEGVVDPEGYLLVTEVADGSVTDLAVTDGAGGTVVKVAGSSTRSGAWNVVVARGTSDDGGQVQGVAYLERGPKIYGGDFNPLPVPYFFPSPLLTTVDQARQAAITTMQRLARNTARMLDITMVPHPAIQGGDVLAVTSPRFTGTAIVENFTLPYTADGGAMTIKARVIE